MIDAVLTGVYYTYLLPDKAPTGKMIIETKSKIKQVGTVLIMAIVDQKTVFIGSGSARGSIVLRTTLSSKTGGTCSCIE